MSKAARFSASTLLSEASAGRPAGERDERDNFLMVTLFSVTGLLMSVVAIQFGLSPVGF
jgi:hypothetical protein